MGAGASEASPALLFEVPTGCEESGVATIPSAVAFMVEEAGTDGP